MNMVNINKADREKLARIAGIGGPLADEIIRYREEHGGFKTLDELDKVPGFDHVAAEKVKRNTYIDTNLSSQYLL